MTEKLTRAVVIGMGEVGRRLADTLEMAGVEVVPVTRTSGWDRAVSDEAGLRLVAVREGALAPVLERLSGLDPARLVLVQNGWVRPLLGSWPGCTRGLIWFAAKGDFFRVLRPSPFQGPSAEPLAAVLDRGGIAATACDPADFARLDAEKMAFNCVVGLPLAVHGLSLEDYLRDRTTEAEALFREAAEVCASAAGVKADEEWWPRFLHSAEPLGWVRVASAKALELRNGAVVRLAHDLGLEAPVNSQLLEAVRTDDA